MRCSQSSNVSASSARCSNQHPRAREPRRSPRTPISLRRLHRASLENAAAALATRSGGRPDVGRALWRRCRTVPGSGNGWSSWWASPSDTVKFTHAPAVVADTPVEAVLASPRRALVHVHCRCTGEIGRLVSTPRAFWWIPALASSNGPAVAVRLEDADSEGTFVEGSCPRTRRHRVPARELLVQALRAQKTGQRRHMWVDCS